MLVDNVTLEESGGPARSFLSIFNQPKAEDVTIFTRDLALLLRAGARINDGLELLAADPDFGRLRPVVAEIRSHVIAGESFAEALARHEGLFPAMYVALIRVGEASGSLDQVLEVLADERSRTEALKRRLGDAIRYPLFVLSAAGCVLLFFLTFVLPQFASVLPDFGAKVDPIILTFLNLSTFLRNNSDVVLAALAAAIAGGWLLLRQQNVRRGIVNAVTQLPAIREVMKFYRTSLFCRNLGLLLGSGVNLTTTLRILVDMMASTGPSAVWTDAGRPGPPWRKTVGCAIRYQGAAADGGADAAAWRRNRAIADAGGPGRRVLRDEAAADARPGGRHCRACGDHHHQHRGRRFDRVCHDGAAFRQSDRRLA